MKRYAVKLKGTNPAKWLTKGRGTSQEFKRARLYTNLGAIKASIGNTITPTVPQEILERYEKAEKAYSDAKRALMLAEKEHLEIDTNRYEVVEFELNLEPSK